MEKGIVRVRDTWHIAARLNDGTVIRSELSAWGGSAEDQYRRLVTAGPKVAASFTALDSPQYHEWFGELGNKFRRLLEGFVFKRDALARHGLSVRLVDHSVTWEALEKKWFEDTTYSGPSEKYDAWCEFEYFRLNHDPTYTGSTGSPLDEEN